MSALAGGLLAAAEQALKDAQRVVEALRPLANGNAPRVMQEQPVWLTVPETQVRLRISKARVYALMEAGQLEAHRRPASGRGIKDGLQWFVSSRSVAERLAAQ